MQNKIKIVKLFDKFRERVIYEALIKIIVGKEARFEMETAGINKGDELTHFRNSPEVSAFYVALKGYEIRDIEGWSRFANGDSTVASLFNEGDVPFVEQAARETSTGYYISSTVDEASSLLVADRRRIDESGLNHAESTESRRTSIQAIEKEERRRAEEALKAGSVVVALAMEDKESGLSDFWQRYRELKEQADPDSVDSESSKNPEDEA